MKLKQICMILLCASAISLVAMKRGAHAITPSEQLPDGVSDIIALDTFLEQAGDDVDFALWKAVHRNHVEVVQGLLVYMGANPNSYFANVKGEKSTPLMTAIGLTHGVAMTRLLLEHGADVDLGGTSELPFTPLTLAATYRDYDIAALLVAKGAEIDRGDYEHMETPLYRATWNSDLKMIRLLGSAGANPECRNRSQQTALDIAQSRGPQLKKYVLKHCHVELDESE